MSIFTGNVLLLIYAVGMQQLIRTVKRVKNSLISLRVMDARFASVPINNYHRNDGTWLNIGRFH